MKHLYRDTCRPVMPYYGEKTQHAAWVNAFLPPASSYVEVFAGSAAVALARPRADFEVINDADDGVANLYRVLLTDAEELRRRLRFTLHSRAEHQRCREAERARSDAPDPDPVEWARRHLVLVRQSFVGKFAGSWAYSRTTACASFSNVVDLIPPVAHRLRGAIIENLHFADLIGKYSDLGEDACWYLDPPYLGSTRVSKHEYRHEMTDAEHVQMLDLAQGIKGAVRISGYPSDLYDQALQGWIRVTKEVTCFAASTTALSRRRKTTSSKRTECLWLNLVAQQRLAPAKRLAA